jgi:SpoVK/Ycf46/Vps4 family AAA+-type ATPase
MKTGYKDERVKTLRAAARAASGMDLLSAETAFAVSVAKTASIDSSIIYAMKRKEIEKSDVLEFLDTTETMEDLGGFKALKFWMEKRRDVFSEEARSYGLSYPKGVLLCGIPGCLSGDTKILIYRPNGGGGRFETLEELYYRFNRKNKEGIDIGVLSAYKRPWAPGRVIETSSLDEQSKCAFKNVIESVVYSGVKDVFRLTTEDGYTIKATKDHKFYTPEGIYVPLAELRRGGFIVTKNTREGGVLVDDFRKGRNSIPSQRMISGVGNHPHARRKSINGLDYFTYPLAALVIEAHLNRLSLEAFLYALSGDIKGLTFIDPILEIHHKDRNRLNNILNNLEPLTTAEHARLHMEEDGNLMNKYQTMGRIQKVSSIDLVGPERTYDIQMRGPYHNFMADGFVVHNSGKSLAAKAIARFLGLKVIKLDLGRVFRSFVGESEGAIRYALQVADAAAPIILWIDEIEKGMAGVQSSGDSDSGIAARVMGTILTWSQERKSSVMMVATANNVFKLPSEVTRKGRFDEIWATALPTLEEREEIFAIHLRKRKRNPEQFNVAAFAERADNFVGAEIEAIVESSLVDAFSDGGRELQDSDVLRAIGETTPQSKRDSEAFSKILDWTEKRARQVSEPVDDAVASKIRKIRAVPNKPVENEEEDI